MGNQTGLDYALVLCPPWSTDMPPLWLAILSGALKAEKFSGRCYDLNRLVHQYLRFRARFSLGEQQLCFMDP